jgi:hypothetical protein
MSLAVDLLRILKQPPLPRTERGRASWTQPPPHGGSLGDLQSVSPMCSRPLRSAELSIICIRTGFFLRVRFEISNVVPLKAHTVTVSKIAGRVQ